MNRKVLLINGKETLMSAEEAFLQFRNLLIKLANSWSVTYEYDDMFQIASLGFVKAYVKYDISMGYQFTTYLYSLVNCELLKYNLKNKKYFELYSLNVSIGEEESIDFIDVIEDETDYGEIAVNNALLGQIDNLLSKLKTKHKQVLMDYYINGLKQREIAEKYNISLNHVSRLLKSSLQKANDFVNDREEVKTPRTKNKITQDALFDAVKKYGISKEGIKLIAEELGFKPSSIQNKIYSLRIHLKLNEGA